MTTGTRKTHDFCWINLMTPEAERARAFFGALFGWTYGEMPGVPGGQLILVGERTAGALMDLAAANMPQGTPPVIGVMVKVESADAAVAKVTSLGGRAEPAFDVLENGRMAMCTDPNGAVFAVWQPKKEAGMDVDSHAHGAPSWFETITSDVGRATAFYATLFGWTPEEQQPVPGMTYTLFKLDGVPVAGAMQALPHVGDVPPHWGMSFAVTNADETVRRGVELGASLCIPVQELPCVGRFALLKSPQGVPFHIVEWARPTGAAE
ncbi:VOC family protein [Polyangium jinanense]|uniref:VOC family protein n=1 Tax=Polyangium jinanense TaxID=2829994 RepID=A0A9X3XFK2_9BACT|nr:VOC family protein [Polyangium jinanense]MDC3957050.1 VOC family protein [Polyangium jinanense]MDC3987076.1 VOC family protein [Polyangium jinanense]